jgi:CubicO group peptidase (beta-lactamase class C family)
MVAVAASLDARDVEVFMNGFINAQLSAHHIAGATVAVVKDGQVILVKGYGYADYANLKPVDGQTTLFRVASIGKLFVWTSVMQLAEQGKIDLNADVNTYLNTFKIPDDFGKPVTMLNLMTHTAGFEDGTRDATVDTLERLQPLGVYLSGHIPERVYPPARSRPIPITGWVFCEQWAISRWYSALLNAYPAGSLTTTAPDLARFMIAHLQDGQYNGTRILEAKTAQEMHS